jgi:hypothetical protein
MDQDADNMTKTAGSDPRNGNNPYGVKIPFYYNEQQISSRRIRNEAKFIKLLKAKYGPH